MKLKAIKIEKSYKSRKVVNKVDLELSQGEIVGLLGPNGAGKTTCFYMIVGLIKSNGGKILIDTIDVSNEPMYKRAINGIGYLAQEASVFRKLTVEENIKAVLELGKLSEKEQKIKLESLIDEFSLNKVRKNRGDLLSGGERRRTEIARALATDPKFLLLDEPFAGVDPIAVEEIQKIISHLKTKNIGVLITDHNVQETLAITDRTYLLKDGMEPITYTIKTKNVFWFDEEKGLQREIKYCKNQQTVFVDEMKGPQNLSHITFLDGVLNVPREDQMLQKFLELHPQNGSAFEEFNPVQIAVDETADLELEIEALMAAKDMDIDMAEAIMRVEIGSEVSNMSSKELKRDLLLYAKRNPGLFLDLVDDDNVVLRNFGIKATAVSYTHLTLPTILLV